MFWEEKNDLSWNDYAGNRNMDNPFITKYLLWSCCRNVPFGYRNCFCISYFACAISDIAHPQWRATSLGVYRFWRDLGFVLGALGIGFIADLFNTSLAIQTVAWIALGSGIFVFIVMHETKRN